VAEPRPVISKADPANRRCWGQMALVEDRTDCQACLSFATCVQASTVDVLCMLANNVAGLPQGFPILMAMPRPDDRRIIAGKKGMLPH